MFSQMLDASSKHMLYLRSGYLSPKLHKNGEEKKTVGELKDLQIIKKGRKT